MSSAAVEKKRVIVLGASPKRNRFSNKAVRCYQELGYEVVPVHPAADEVEGLPVVAKLADAPRAQLLLSYVRPELLLPIVSAAADIGVRRIFLNPGADSDELAEKIRALGIEPLRHCAIVAAGRSPSEFPDE